MFSKTKSTFVEPQTIQKTKIKNRLNAELQNGGTYRRTSGNKHQPQRILLHRQTEPRQHKWQTSNGNEHRPTTTKFVATTFRYQISFQIWRFFVLRPNALGAWSWASLCEWIRALAEQFSEVGANCPHFPFYCIHFDHLSVSKSPRIWALGHKHPKPRTAPARPNFTLRKSRCSRGCSQHSWNPFEMATHS